MEGERRAKVVEGFSRTVIQMDAGVASGKRRFMAQY